MAERNYNVFCDDGCKYPSMTKEQILTAIEQAMTTGKIQDVDTGFVTKLKEQNSGSALSFWIGTSAEYNALEAKELNCFYILTDDTAGDDLKAAIEELQARVIGLESHVALQPEIIVTARGGQITCVNAETGEAFYNRGTGDQWRFVVPYYGAYTITGTNGDLTETQTVTVDAVKQHYISIMYYSDVFAENDWATIAEMVQLGIVPDTWVVGDEKDVVCTDGETYAVRILGKNHDEYTSGEKAPITFAFAPDPATTAAAPINSKGMYAEATTAASWTGSTMYTEHLPALLASLPPELQDNIVAVNKLTAGADGTVTASADKLFLLSEVEYMGDVSFSAEGEGAQYEYYKNGNFEKTESSTVSYLWLRSIQSDDASQFVAIRRTESAASAYCVTQEAETTTQMYAYPAFCF